MRRLLWVLPSGFMASSLPLDLSLSWAAHPSCCLALGGVLGRAGEVEVAVAPVAAVAPVVGSGAGSARLGPLCLGFAWLRRRSLWSHISSSVSVPVRRCRVLGFAVAGRLLGSTRLSPSLPTRSVPAGATVRWPFRRGPPWCWWAPYLQPTGFVVAPCLRFGSGSVVAVVPEASGCHGVACGKAWNPTPSSGTGVGSRLLRWL